MSRLIKVEVVLELHEHRNRMTPFHRGHELDLARGGDGAFGEPERQRVQRAYLDHFTSTRKDRAQRHGARDLIASCFFSVLRICFGQDTRSLIDLRHAVTSASISAASCSVSTTTVLPITAAGVSTAAGTNTWSLTSADPQAS